MNNSENNISKKNNDITINWPLTVIVNIIIILAVLLAYFKYFSDQLEFRLEAALRNFSATMSAMEQVAYGHLRYEQIFCNNWSSYISNSNMNVDEAIEFARSVNTDPLITTHIISYDTLQGISSDGSSVDYKTAGDDGFTPGFLEEVENCALTGQHPHITHAFPNPADGVMSIGFCHNIRITDENGEASNKLLIRVIPVSEFHKQWVFPAGYNGAAKLSMIDLNGKYIVSSKYEQNEVFLNGNFFENIARNNNLSEEQKQELKNTFAANKNGILRYLDRNGNKAAYAYCRLGFNEEWFLIGYITEDDLKVIPLDLTIVMIVIVGFIVLMFFDGGYLIKMNKRLKTAMQETNHANEAKTKFLSSMSHDIRTPMNAIIGMTTIARRRIDDKEQVNECLKKIDLASNHLLTLINDVLDISKVESGRLSMNPIVFSMAELVSNVVNIAQPHIKEKNMDFNIHARNITHEYVYADELRINQIFINLLSNAIKYTPAEGRISLDIEEQPSDVGPNMTKIIYTVSDNGIGMSEEFMKNMYTAFTRDTDTRINSVQGTGLGLAITKQMVDLMNGSIEAKSAPDKGTTFKVTIDVPIAEKMVDDYVLPPLKLLVADDDEIFLESAKDTLQSLGLETDIVNNGRDAVKMVTEHHERGFDYPCVIIDWKMPIMSGLETTKAIREKVGDDVPVIIISSYDWTEIEEEAVKVGANGFINKPLFRSNVYNKLNELLNFDTRAKNPSEDNTDDLKGINLLIAEDNDINWDIIQVSLEFCGITSERAENGQICVDKINEAPAGTYQAILMDVQMPVMNGKDAARAIRASEKEHVKNIPIIAMTADAFAEDITACLEAGMNSHVPKPLDMKKLLKELRAALKSSKNERV